MSTGAQGYACATPVLMNPAVSTTQKKNKKPTWPWL